MTMPAFSPLKPHALLASPPRGAPQPGTPEDPMLSPANAWRILCTRTGGAVSRATFYRWVASGRVFSIRVGHKFSIPWSALEEIIKQCLAGERF
ncbi:MAG: hypothetical protein ACLQOO_02745 [Terriglobia bacterium]